MSDRGGRIEHGLHVLPLRVYWEDTDAAGIVYYANYLKFTERARTDMLRLLGINQSALLADEGLAFAVRECVLEYLKPARLDDEIEVHSRITELGGVRLGADQAVKRDGLDLVRSRVRLACIDMTGRPRRLPTSVREALAPLVPRADD